jgi:hypothetical protein
MKIIFDYFRTELADVNYNFNLVQTGEQEVVHVLQATIQRQSNADSLNKQLSQERSNYLSGLKVDLCVKMKYTFIIYLGIYSKSSYT